MAAVTCAACTRSRQTEFKLPLDQTFRFNIETEPPTLDWTKVTDTVSAQLAYNLMDALVEYDLDDPEVHLIPGLATKWQASPDARVWTFTIRPNVLWTDGVPFTPQHVVDGIERLLNPKTGAEYAYTFFPVKNAKAYNTGSLRDFADVGVKVSGDQVIFELADPKSYFPMILTNPSCYPVRKDLIAKFGDRWTDPRNLQVLGPFKLKSWAHDKTLALERNETYWGPKSKVGNVLLYMINDGATAINLFDSGKLDAIYRLRSRDVLSQKTRPEYRNTSLLNVIYYGFNTKRVPTDSVLVRRALAHAVDRSQIALMLANGDQAISGLVPKGLLGFDPDAGLKFDVALAKRLLVQAGYGPQNPLPKVAIAFNTNEDHQRVAENVQAQLKKNLNIQVELENMEWKTYLAALHIDPPIFRMGWQGDFPDPDNFLGILKSYSDNNYTKWKNRDYDKLIEEGAWTLDLKKRREIYMRASKILLETDVAIVPLYSQVGQYLISKRVEHFPINILERLRFDRVELKK